MKSSKNIVIQRVKKIVDSLLAGQSRDEIVHYSSVKWKIGERQTDKYIAKARDTIERSIKREVDFDYSKAVRRYEELYKLALNNKDYRTAMTINKELSNLQGLHRIQIEHSGKVQFISSVPD
jgi:hypothetical protein